MFNREAAAPSNQPDRVLRELDVRPGQHVVDLGAGGGYYSLRLAELVGETGWVYAVDTNAAFLEYIADEARRRGLTNVLPLWVRGVVPELAGQSIDLVFIRDAYHHIPNPVTYMRRLKLALRTGGRVAIIEFLPNVAESHHPPGHAVDPACIIEQMEEAGFGVERALYFLPEQSFTIFRPVGDSAQPDA